MSKLLLLLVLSFSALAVSGDGTAPGASIAATSDQRAAANRAPDRLWFVDEGGSASAPIPSPRAAAVARGEQSAQRTWSPPEPQQPSASPGVATTRPLVVGSAQQALINGDRGAAGLSGLNWSSCLAAIAQSQAQAMANAGTIFHGSGVTQDLGCRLGSSQTGENVGEWGNGACDSCINQLFMASAPHRANILGPYRYVGTAWVTKGGIGYIAVEFA